MSQTRPHRILEFEGIGPGKNTLFYHFVQWYKYVYKWTASKNALDGEEWWWQFMQLNTSIHMMGIKWSSKKKESDEYLLVSVSLLEFWYLNDTFSFMAIRKGGRSASMILS